MHTTYQLKYFLILADKEFLLKGFTSFKFAGVQVKSQKETEYKGNND